MDRFLFVHILHQKQTISNPLKLEIAPVSMELSVKAGIAVPRIQNDLEIYANVTRKNSSFYGFIDFIVIEGRLFTEKLISHFTEPVCVKKYAVLVGKMPLPTEFYLEDWIKTTAFRGECQFVN
jgi:hypothetical protein